MSNRDKATAWARTVGDWIGDSPWKALTFGVVCFALGYLAGYMQFAA